MSLKSRLWPRIFFLVFSLKRCVLNSIFGLNIHHVTRTGVARNLQFGEGCYGSLRPKQSLHQKLEQFLRPNSIEDQK